MAVVIAAAFFTLIVYLPLYFQGPLGYGPTQAGLALLPLGVPLLLMGPVSGRLAAVIPPKFFLSLGLLIIAVGAACIALAPQSGVAAVYVGMFIAGIGAGLINGELSNVAISVVAPERSGMASGINNTMRQFGYGVGIAGLGALFGGLIVSGLADRGQAFAERVASGDIAAAVAASPMAEAETARLAADAAFVGAFSTICFVAAGIAALGALLAFVLIRRDRSAERPSSLIVESGRREIGRSSIKLRTTFTLSAYARAADDRTEHAVPRGSLLPNCARRLKGRQCFDGVFRFRITAFRSFSFSTAHRQSIATGS